MNREEFEARYELIAQVSEGVFESHHALHHSGVVVMAHFVSGSAELKDAVQAAAEGLRADETDHHVIESHRIDEHLVVVTRFLRDFESLDGWLASQGYPLGAVDAADAGPAGGAGDTAPAEGEFTRMFMAGQGLEERPGSGETGAANGSSSGSSESVDPSHSGAEPGTGSESAPAGGPVADAAAAAPPPPEPPAAESRGSGPGEFTQMFRAVPPESEPSAPPSTPTTVDEPSAQPPDRKEPAPPGPHSIGAPSPSSDTPAGDEPGEFTQMFRAVGSQPPKAAPPGGAAGVPTDEAPPASREPEQPGAHRDQGRRDDLRGADSPPGAADRFAPPPKEETGEFTQFFRAAEGAGHPDQAEESSLDWSDAPIAGRKREPDPPPTPPQQSDDWAKALRTDRPSAPHRSSVPPSPPAEQTPQDHGEFTQIFGAETPPIAGSGAGAPAQSDTPAKGKVSPPASRTPSSGGGFKAPKVPKARMPDAEALIRGGRMRRGKPPRFRPPRGRRLARMGAGAALGAAQAALSGGGGAAEEDGADASGDGLSSSTFKIVLAVIVIVAVALVAFFAFWDFGGAPTEDVPVADSVVAAPVGPEG